MIRNGGELTAALGQEVLWLMSLVDSMTCPMQILALYLTGWTLWFMLINPRNAFVCTGTSEKILCRRGRPTEWICNITKRNRTITGRIFTERILKSHLGSHQWNSTCKVPFYDLHNYYSCEPAEKCTLAYLTPLFLASGAFELIYNVYVKESFGRIFSEHNMTLRQGRTLARTSKYLNGISIVASLVCYNMYLAIPLALLPCSVLSYLEIPDTGIVVSSVILFLKMILFMLSNTLYYKFDDLLKNYNP